MKQNYKTAICLDCPDYKECDFTECMNENNINNVKRHEHNICKTASERNAIAKKSDMDINDYCDNCIYAFECHIYISLSPNYNKIGIAKSTRKRILKAR